MSVEITELSPVDAMMQAEALDPALKDRNLRFIRSDPKSLGLRTAQGYEIIKDPEGTRIKTYMPRQADGTYQFGDLVLASCPKDLHEMRVRHRKRKLLLWTEGIKGRFRQEVEGLNKEVVDSRGGLPSDRGDLIRAYEPGDAEFEERSPSQTKSS